MQLNSDQVRSLKRYLFHSRSTVQGIEERESSRIEGEIMWEECDLKGYSSVIAYIECGLSRCEDLVTQVLRTVQQVQEDNRLKYPVCLFSFGWEDSRLHHKGQARQGVGGQMFSVQRWAKELCSLSGDKKITPVSVIPELFPFANPYGPKGKVGPGDLLLFFCHDRNLRMAEIPYDQYNPRRVRQSVWLFCGGNTPELAMGDFVPDVANAATTEKVGNREPRTEIRV